MKKLRSKSIVTENSMKYKKPFIYARLGFATLFAALVFMVSVPSAVFAVNYVDCPDGTSVALPTTSDYPTACAAHMTVKPIDPLADPATKCTKDSCDLFKKYLNPTIDLLAALVGVAVVFSIIAGGIQYAASAGDPQKAAKAKMHIYNAVLALIAFAFLFGFLQWIVPGGLLNK